MKKQDLDCRVSFTEKGIVINSGLPEAEPVLDFGVGKHHGTIEVHQNGCADVTYGPSPVVVPPRIDEVLRDNNLTVKRTSRNFIVTMKFPIIENATETTACHKEMWKKSQKAIASARQSLAEQLTIDKVL